MNVKKMSNRGIHIVKKKYEVRYFHIFLSTDKNYQTSLLSLILRNIKEVTGKEES